MECLPQELGACKASLDTARFAALFGDGCDAAVGLNFGRGLEAAAIATEGNQQSRGQCGSGTGQGPKHGRVVVSRKELVDFCIELGDGLIEELDVLDQHLHELGVWGDDGGVCGERLHFANLLDRGVDLFVVAMAVLAKEFTERGWVSALQFAVV